MGAFQDPLIFKPYNSQVQQVRYSRSLTSPDSMCLDCNFLLAPCFPQKPTVEYLELTSVCPTSLTENSNTSSHVDAATKWPSILLTWGGSHQLEVDCWSLLTCATDPFFGSLTMSLHPGIFVGSVSCSAQIINLCASKIRHGSCYNCYFTIFYIL